MLFRHVLSDVRDMSFEDAVTEGNVETGHSMERNNDLGINAGK